MRTFRNVHVQIHGSDLDLIENWRRSQPQIPAMATAVRILALQSAKASTDVPDGKLPSAKDQAA
jgi:hypothetical protein